MNLALLHQRRGELSEARHEYERTIAYASWFVPAYVNLADLLRVLGDEAGAERTLRRALAEVPDEPSVMYALGLSLVRQQRTPESLPLLARAASLEPSSSRLSFAYALALESQGRDRDALRVIDQALSRRPDDRDLLEAAIAISRKRPVQDDARRYVRRLLEVAPGDPGVRALARELGVF